MDYGSRRGGSKKADAADEYHPLFNLDYIGIMGLPLKPLTRISDRFFDNVTVTFKDWHMAYTGKMQHELPFDLQHRTFRIASAATRETWFVVMHPVITPLTELLSRAERSKKRAKSSRQSALKFHHAQALASYIKQTFLSHELVGERVEPSWNLNSSLSQKLTSNKWTLFQDRFMEDWPTHVERYSHDAFWRENQPVFHAYDYGANIPIEVGEHLQSLQKEKRMRPDDHEDNSSDDDSISETESNVSEDRRQSQSTNTSAESIGFQTQQVDDDWLLDPESSANGTDGLYSDGLKQLRAELEQKWELENISHIEYALAVDIHCAEANSSDPNQRKALCMLANKNLVRREYPSARNASDLTFYSLGHHPCFGNFTSAKPPAFLKDHVLTVAQDNAKYLNGGAEVLSYGPFQAYCNIKRQIRYNFEDLSAAQGIATAALTLPVTDASCTKRVIAKQQRLFNHLQGKKTPDDISASKPFARERRRIEHAIEKKEFAYRQELVIKINVARLIPRRRNLRTVLQPIFQLMRFYLQEPEHYTHILQCFQPEIFPRILGSFSRMFEAAIDEMVLRFQAQGSTGLDLALSEGVAALDRLGNYCLTGSSKVLMKSVLKPLGTIDSMQRGGWPFIDPAILDLRYGGGGINVMQWPRDKDGRPVFMHVASLRFHYGPEVAASRHSLVWFRDLGGKSIRGPTSATRFLEDLFRELWVPQMVTFVSQQALRRISGEEDPSSQVLQEQRSIIETWAKSTHPFAWR